jgi:hypothetical protein
VGVLTKNILNKLTLLSQPPCGTEFAGGVFTLTLKPVPFNPVFIFLRGPIMNTWVPRQAARRARLGLHRFDLGVESVAAQQVGQVLRKGGAWHHHVTACFHSFRLQVALQMGEKTDY